MSFLVRHLTLFDGWTRFLHPQNLSDASRTQRSSACGRIDVPDLFLTTSPTSTSASSLFTTLLHGSSADDPAIISLHWLCVQERVSFKFRLADLTYRSVRGTSRSYLYSRVSPVSPTWQLNIHVTSLFCLSVCCMQSWTWLQYSRPDPTRPTNEVTQPDPTQN